MSASISTSRSKRTGAVARRRGPRRRSAAGVGEGSDWIGLTPCRVATQESPPLRSGYCPDDALAFHDLDIPIERQIRESVQLSTGPANFNAVDLGRRTETQDFARVM